MKKENIPEVRDSLAHHPTVNEQECAVRLSEGFLKSEGKHNIQAFGNIQLERRDEEADASRSIWKSLRKISRDPPFGVEAGKMPSLTLSKESTFVHHASDFVREAIKGVVKRYLVYVLHTK